MQTVASQTGHVGNLTNAIEAVIPWRTAFRIVHQPFERDFAMVEVPDAFAKAFRCDTGSREEQQKALEGTDHQYGNYYGAIFRFKAAEMNGGVLGLLWTKEKNAWRVVAWEVFEP
jgi:hypothetical protein